MSETTTKELEEVLVKQELLINALQEDLVTVKAINKDLKASITRLQDLYEPDEFYCL